MMKKFFSLVAAMILALSLTIPASAVQLDHITDDAGILSDSEWSALEARARALAEQYPCGLYVIIVDDYADFGSSVDEASDYIYQQYELGLGPDGDAFVLLLSMADRDYSLDDYGEYGEYAMTDYGNQTIEDAMLDNFGEDDWYGGISDYLEQSAVLLEAAQNGAPLDVAEKTLGEKAPMAYGIALVVGIVIAFITCNIFKAQMKTAVRATSAEEYVSPMGVNMRIRDDRYTHTTRKERRIEKKSSGGSDGDSGSTGKF